MSPKALSESIRNGWNYLVNQQHADGGWSQGGGWRSDGQGGRVEGPNVHSPADVANTCMATLALLRGGITPRDGEHADAVSRGLDFVMRHVEGADAESPYVTELRDTQVQVKIGPYVDTFLSALVLAEAKGQMGDDAGEARASAALDKVIDKMTRHQQADGSWAMRGWAPVVGQALAAAGLNRARQKGANVRDETLDRSHGFSDSQFDTSSKKFAFTGSAGVPLYSMASHLSAKQHSVNSYRSMKQKLRSTLEDEQTPQEEKILAEEKLDFIDKAELSQQEALSSSYASFSDGKFVSGFGSNGGEEFLSYLNISETLFIKGGKEWDDWDASVSKNLEQIQNKDGSWSGHHCITGRTFCTSAALLVLLADRAPRPDEAHVVQ